MLKKKLELFFITTIVVALLYLANNIYTSQQFKNNPISDTYKTRIKDKEIQVLNLMKKNYNIRLDIPLLVTDKFKGRLYGLTSYKENKITIYLNKKVMQESMNYIVNSVIAHEYAHALMFKLGYMHTKDDGHSQQWQEICFKLGGDDCQQYVDRREIVMSKMPF